jgi:hypothetical protein
MSTGEEILETLKDRFRSPIIGNFIISFLITNWKIPYVTFFVSEDKCPYHTKIDVISSIISSYGNYWIQLWYLLIVPFLWVCFIVYIYPKIQSYVQKIKIRSEFEIKKYNLENTIEYQKKKNEYEILIQQNQFTIDNSVKELNYRILNDDISIQKVFFGFWSIDIQYKKNKENFHMTFHQCSFTDVYCITNEKNILFEFDRFEKEDKDTYLNASIFLKFITTPIHDASLQFHIRIINRGHIELSNSINNITITLRWEQMFPGTTV